MRDWIKSNSLSQINRIYVIVKLFVSRSNNIIDRLSPSTLNQHDHHHHSIQTKTHHPPPIGPFIWAHHGSTLHRPSSAFLDTWSPKCVSLLVSWFLMTFARLACLLHDSWWTHDTSRPPTHKPLHTRTHTRLNEQLPSIPQHAQSCYRLSSPISFPDTRHWPPIWPPPWRLIP